jgi:hypothetical protein
MLGLTATVGGGVPPSSPPSISAFKSTGCSVFPDGNAYGCCYVHDMAYWEGGTAADRRRADLALHQCVVNVTGWNYASSGLMYAAVTIFGLPGVPTRVKFGYGWGDSRPVGYHALTPEERALVDARKQELCKSYTPAPDPEKVLVDNVHWIRAGDARSMCAALDPRFASTQR